MNHLTWLEALVIGGLQGVTELFPVSSLGHSVLLPALVGGSWASDLDVGAPSRPTSRSSSACTSRPPSRSSCTSAATGCGSSAGWSPASSDREVAEPDQRLAWLLVLATIPVGIAGLTLEHVFRVS